MKRVILIGGIGNGTVIASAIQDANQRGATDLEVAGFLNDRIPAGGNIEGYKVLGNLSDIKRFIEQEFFFLYTVYKINGNRDRLTLFNDLNIPDSLLPVFIHPSAYVAENVKLAPGTVIMPNVSVSPGFQTGKATLVMVGATLGHNSKCGDHCHFAAQSCISSFCEIGKGVHIGLNATVREEVKIGDYSVLGMGSVLLKNIPDNELWAGNPANKIKDIQV